MFVFADDYTNYYIPDVNKYELNLGIKVRF